MGWEEGGELGEEVGADVADAWWVVRICLEGLLGMGGGGAFCSFWGDLCLDLDF